MLSITTFRFCYYRRIPMEVSQNTQTYYIDPVLYNGRPHNCQDRLEKEIRTYDLLDQLHIPYQRLDHDAVPTIDACHDVDNILGIEICKNLFLTNAQKSKFYLLLMPGTKKFRTKDLSKQIGSARLSFAAPEFMERFLDITPGSVSILGLMNDTQNHVQLIIDRDVIDGHPFIGCHPCINTSSLRLKTADILEHFLPAIHHSYLLVDLPEN